MNDIGDLTADYRALVLFRTNFSTPSTLRPQIELGKAMRSRMLTWFRRGYQDTVEDTPERTSRPKRNKTRHSNGDKDTRSKGLSDDILSVLRAAQFRS
jgi:hypothetical protein